MNSPIWPEIQLARDFMNVLVTCKFDEAPIENEVVVDQTTFSPYKSMGAFGCHGNQFSSNLPPNLMQPFPHSNDASNKI